MTNITHTQGPWWFDDYNYIVVGSRETCVTIAEIDCSILRKAEREANAHLIAAAPDLLAACEAMAAQLGGGDSFTQWEEAKARLLAAIAKANGA